MAYIHAKKVGDTTYYTLRISVRKNGKVITKDIENLGTDLSKVSIEDLEKRHKAEIRKSYQTIKKFLEKNYYAERIREKKLKKDPFLDAEQLIRIEACREHFTNVFLHAHELTRKDAYENFLLKFAVNSTSIEGNTITLKEAAILFAEDILPEGRTFREVHDLKNTKTVFHWLQQEKPKITLELIENIHDRLLENIDKRKGYRTEDINIFGQPFRPTPGRYVKEDVKLLLAWLKEEKKIHPFVLAVLFHHKFENIHPFSDGNGRTGRMLMNHLLQRSMYPPVVISRRRRKEYLDVMSRADAAIKKDVRGTEKKHYAPLLAFAVDELEESYWDTFLL